MIHYQEIMRYIQDCGYYNDTALRQWSQIDVADPWLIAAAKAQHLELVTFETNIHTYIHLTKRIKPKRFEFPMYRLISESKQSFSLI